MAVLVGHRDIPLGGQLRGDAALTWSRDGTGRAWRIAPDPRVVPAQSFALPVKDAALATTSLAAVARTEGGAVEAYGPAGYCRDRLPAGRYGEALAVAISRTGSVAVTGHTGRVAQLWSLSSCTSRGLIVHGDPVHMTALDATGETVATGGRGGRLMIWQAGSRKAVREIQTELRTLVAGAFSPSGRRVAVGDATGAVGVYDLASGKEIVRLGGHRTRITGVAFSPDETRVATTSFGQDARIWRASDGRLEQRLPHNAAVNGVAFSPDSRWVVTAGPQRALLWDADTGETVLKLVTGVGTEPVRAVSFSDDGRWIYTVDGGRGRYRCEVCGDVDELRAVADALLRRLDPAGGG
jgi:WD40 repeat protein